MVTLVDVVAQQRQDFTALATDVRDYMEHTITLITVVRTKLSELRIGLKAEISELRTDTGAGFAAVDARFDQVDAEIRRIKDQLAS